MVHCTLREMSDYMRLMWCVTSNKRFYWPKDNVKWVMDTVILLYRGKLPPTVNVPFLNDTAHLFSTTPWLLVPRPHFDNNCFETYKVMLVCGILPGMMTSEKPSFLVIDTPRVKRTMYSRLSWSISPWRSCKATARPKNQRVITFINEISCSHQFIIFYPSPKLKIYNHHIPNHIQLATLRLDENSTFTRAHLKFYSSRLDLQTITPVSDDTYMYRKQEDTHTYINK